MKKFCFILFFLPLFIFAETYEFGGIITDRVSLNITVPQTPIYINYINGPSGSYLGASNRYWEVAAGQSLLLQYGSGDTVYAFCPTASPDNPVSLQFSFTAAPPEPENPDPENPDPENPDPENPDPENPEPDLSNLPYALESTLQTTNSKLTSLISHVMVLPDEIFALHDDVSAINSDTSTISSNSGTIATNTGTISSNTGTIATNMGTIASNTGTIATYSGTISTNTGTIASNTGTIATYSGTISTNTGTIASNTGTIASNTGTIASNTTSIKNDVASMKSDLSALKDVLTQQNSLPTPPQRMESLPVPQSVSALDTIKRKIMPPRLFTSNSKRQIIMQFDFPMPAGEDITWQVVFPFDPNANNQLPFDSNTYAIILEFISFFRTILLVLLAWCFVKTVLTTLRQW